MVNTRTSSTLDVPATSQSPTLANRIGSVTSMLDRLAKTLDDLPAVTEFEKGVKDYLGYLHAQVTEIKVEQSKLREEMLIRNHQMRDSVADLTVSVAKTEQYSRKDTVTVDGLPMPEGAESQADLCSKVAGILLGSGETVSVQDLSAVHRNSNDNKVIRGKTIPPSITVRFCRINKKDNVLRGYRNYDSARNRPRDVKVYQSLSPHYAELRKSMYDFLNCKPSENQSFGRIKNVDLKPKWVTYQSPTSGFAVKLASGEYFNGIHSLGDFVNHIFITNSLHAELLFESLIAT